jgi:hypothetical protein
VDNWILQQLRLKNLRYSRASLGLHIMDRAPLDAFAFEKKAAYPQRASAIYAIACSAETGAPQPFISGSLIFLTGRASDIADRQRWRGREGDEKYIERQQKALLRAYGARKIKGCQVIDTGGLSVDEVVKQTLGAIYLKPYIEYSMQSRLQTFLPGTSR